MSLRSLWPDLFQLSFLRIRTNLSEYPGAQGSVTMNGDRLLDDSKELIEQLEEEISASGYPMMFVTG